MTTRSIVVRWNALLVLSKVKTPISIYSANRFSPASSFCWDPALQGWGDPRQHQAYVNIQRGIFTKYNYIPKPCVARVWISYALIHKILTACVDWNKRRSERKRQQLLPRSPMWCQLAVLTLCCQIGPDFPPNLETLAAAVWSQGWEIWPNLATTSVGQPGHMGDVS